MGIQKQEFYEGAALHILACTGKIQRIRYQHPFFILNDDILALLKYSTRSRSPWGFTLTPEEQEALKKRAEPSTLLGLICGADGVAAFPYGRLLEIATLSGTALHLSCYRKHREHYEVNGPNGTLPQKVAPSNWSRILDS